MDELADDVVANETSITETNDTTRTETAGDEIAGSVTRSSGEGEPTPVDADEARGIGFGSLVFGVVFVVIGIGLMATGGDLEADTAWLWAVALGVLGVGGIVATLSGIRRQRAAT